MIDLKPFCGTDETRPYLLKPFSFEDRTYATDGRIMVRVPRMADVPEITKHADWNKPMEGIDTVTLSPLSLTLPPKPPHGEECSACDGSAVQMVSSIRTGERHGASGWRSCSVVPCGYALSVQVIRPFTWTPRGADCAQGIGEANDDGIERL